MPCNEHGFETNKRGKRVSDTPRLRRKLIMIDVAPASRFTDAVAYNNRLELPSPLCFTFPPNGVAGNVSIGLEK